MRAYSSILHSLSSFSISFYASNKLTSNNKRAIKLRREVRIPQDEPNTSIYYIEYHIEKMDCG